MRIFKVMDLSTRHLPVDLRGSQWALHSFDGLIVDDHGDLDPHGWWLWVPENPDEYAADYGEDYPAEVLAVQRYARDEHDCDWVLFDADAEVIDGLPTYDDGDYLDVQ